MTRSLKPRAARWGGSGAEALSAYPAPMSPARGASVEFRDVTKRYADQVAVDGLSLAVPAGKICVLVGPTGSGKTTSLKMGNPPLQPPPGALPLARHHIFREDPPHPPPPPPSPLHPP